MNHIEKLLARKQKICLEDQKALNKLLEQDTYNTEFFSESHRQFKQLHNDVFASLAQNCSGKQHRPVFYLDGMDGSTTRTLRSAGWKDEELFIANIFPDTAETLRICHGVKNVYVGRAEDVLKNKSLSHIQFAAYYLDGCGGSSAPLLSMIDAVFCETRIDKNLAPIMPFAIGITLTESDSIGRRSLADREQDVTRGLATLAASRGLRIDYVGDNPGRYGLNESPMRREGITQTVWIHVSSNVRVCEYE